MDFSDFGSVDADGGTLFDVGVAKMLLSGLWYVVHGDHLTLLFEGEREGESADDVGGEISLGEDSAGRVTVPLAAASASSAGPLDAAAARGDSFGGVGGRGGIVSNDCDSNSGGLSPTSGCTIAIKFEVRRRRERGGAQFGLLRGRKERVFGLLLG